MKIIVLILGYHHEICYNYIKTIEKTWGTSTNSNINIIYSFGGSNTNSFDGKIINVVDEDYGAKNTYKKLLSVLEVAYNNLDFDIILKTSLNAYFRLDIFEKIISTYDLKDFFGSASLPGFNKNYPNGMSMLLSRDVVEKIIKNKDLWPADKNPSEDDVGIGMLLKKIYPNYFDIYIHFDRKDIGGSNLSQLEDPLFKTKNDNIWCFRCKSLDRSLDLKKMELLQKIFY